MVTFKGLFRTHFMSIRFVGCPSITCCPVIITCFGVHRVEPFFVCYILVAAVGQIGSVATKVILK